MAEPAGPELSEFHEVAVGVADRRNPRLLAQLRGRVTQWDPAPLQPPDHAGQVEDHEGQLDRARAACLVLRVVLGGMDREVHVAELASPVRLSLTVPFFCQWKAEHIPVKLCQSPGLGGDEDYPGDEP
jgi:hypothetical protein